MTAASYTRIAGANDRVGVGVIGFGLIGKQHVGDFKKMKDVDLVALCDVYKPRLEAAAARNRSSERAAAITRAPRSTSRRQTSPPIPPLPPTTT